jgi:translocator protein
VGQIASRSQLRASFLRWAMVTVPLIVFLGFLMGRLSNSGFSNGWFASLARPDWFPPGAVFGIVWTILYAMMGLSLAMILDAKGARKRDVAVGLFVGQLVLNLAWSPLFFAAHQVTAALVLIIATLVMAILTTRAFWRIRPVAAWLLVPYLAWLMFATALNFEMDRLNPDAETYRPSSGAQFTLPPAAE